MDRRPWVAPAAGLLLLFISLLPARATALRGDDAGFHLNGLLDITGETLAGTIFEAWVDALERMRPQLLAGVQSNVGIYVFGGHPTAYKLFLVALTVLCAALLWRLLRRLGAPVAVAALALAILATSIQFRAYHDPVLGYFGTTQTALACVLGSLLVFLSALRTGRGYVVSALLFAAACLLHEYAYPVAAAHLVLALHDRRGVAALRAAAAPLAVGILFTLVSFVGRLGVAPQEAFLGYELTTSPASSLRSFFVQLVPPLPGAARTFDQGTGVFFPSGTDATAPELLAGLWRGAVVFAVVAAAGLLLARHLPAPGLLARLASVGVVLWTTPVLLLAVAPKYQLELTAGKGYLPVLFQAAGLALALSAVYLGLLRLAVARSTAAVRLTVLAAALLFGYAGAVTGFNNVRVAALDNLFRESRDLIETAADHEVLAGVAPGTTLLFSAKDTTWGTGDWRLGQHTAEAVLLAQGGVLYDVRISADHAPFDCPARRDLKVPADCENLRDRAAWVRARPRPGGGSVFVAPLENATTANFRDLPVHTVRAYNSAPQPPDLIGTTAGGRPWRADPAAWKRIDGGDGWSLHELAISGDPPISYTLDDANAKVDFLALPGPEGRVRIYGTRRLLP